MREYFTYGSVRGAAGDGGPYRVRVPADLPGVLGKIAATTFASKRGEQRWPIHE